MPVTQTSPAQQPFGHDAGLHGETHVRVGPSQIFPVAEQFVQARPVGCPHESSCVPGRQLPAPSQQPRHVSGPQGRGTQTPAWQSLFGGHGAHC